MIAATRPTGRVFRAGADGVPAAETAATLGNLGAAGPGIAGAAGPSGTGVVAEVCLVAILASALPHALQNLALGAFGALHWSQATVVASVRMDAPHDLQNRDESAFSTAHVRHFFAKVRSRSVCLNGQTHSEVPYARNGTCRQRP